MNFKDPYLLLLIPVLIVVLYWVNRRQRRASLNFPSSDLVRSLPKTWKVRFFWVPLALRYLILFLFVIALAGPRSVLEEIPHDSEVVDIILAIDLSSSMAAEDFLLEGKRFNRLEVVKNVVSEFIDIRKSDRIGLIAFAGRAYTASPLTTDTNWLKMNLNRLHLNMMEDGTAIGSAITAALTRLQKSDAKSKLIILLTDGVSNRGKVDPSTAAKAALALNVKIYTIGAGTTGMAPYPVQDVWGRRGYQSVPVEIDEKTLQEIANITEARYFRATDTTTLRQIYQEIDRLEKTKIEESGYREYKELFPSFLGLALILLILVVVIENTIFLRLP